MDGVAFPVSDSGTDVYAVEFHGTRRICVYVRAMGPSSAQYEAERIIDKRGLGYTNVTKKNVTIGCGSHRFKSVSVVGPEDLRIPDAPWASLIAKPKRLVAARAARKGRRSRAR